MPAPSIAVPREPHDPQRARTRQVSRSSSRASSPRPAQPRSSRCPMLNGVRCRQVVNSSGLTGYSCGRASDLRSYVVTIEIAKRSPYGQRPSDVRSGQLGAHDAHRLVGPRLRDGRRDAHRRRRQARAQRGGRGRPAARAGSTPARSDATVSRAGCRSSGPRARDAAARRAPRRCRWTRASTAAPAGAARRATVSTCRKSCSAVASSAPSLSRAERVEDVQPARVAVEHLRRDARAGRRAAPRAGARGGSRP